MEKSNLQEVHKKKIARVFFWCFGILELFFIFLTLLNSGEGGFGVFIFLTILAFFIALIISAAYGGVRRFRQVEDIIESKHQEINKKKD